MKVWNSGNRPSDEEGEQESPGGEGSRKTCPQTLGHTAQVLGKDGENDVKENRTDEGLTVFHVEKSLRAELNGM